MFLPEVMQNLLKTWTEKIKIFSQTSHLYQDPNQVLMYSLTF